MTGRFHPLAWIIVICSEIVGWCILKDSATTTVLLVHNGALISIWCTPTMRHRFITYFTFMGAWGLLLYLLIGSNAEWGSEQRLFDAYRTTVSILFAFSLVVAVNAVVDSDAVVAVALSLGCSIQVIRLAYQTSALLKQLIASGGDAFAIQELTGRAAKSMSQRITLLRDVVIAAVFRLLVANQEASTAVATRLRQARSPNRLLNHVPFGSRDIVFVLIYEAGLCALLLFVKNVFH
jgi:hypothetical protein